MISNLHRLRSELDDRRQRGLREKVSVDYLNLMAIIDDYERIDSHMRATSIPHEASLDQQLDLVVRAIFHRHERDAVSVIADIMGLTLQHLEEIEKTRKVLDIQKRPYA